MTLIAGFIIIVISVGLLGFCVLAFARPESASDFMRMFASTRRAHFVEQGIRILVGISLMLYSSESAAPMAFHLFGGVLIATSVGLMILPWRLHKRFADKVIPVVIRFLRVYAAFSALLGAALLYGVVT